MPGPQCVKNGKYKNKFKVRLIMIETVSYFQEEVSKKSWENVFTTSDVNSIFNKFLYYGANKMGIDWMKSYTHNRKRRVDINVNNIRSYSSTWEIVKQRVPQG
jgi:hypothetical protein